MIRLNFNPELLASVVSNAYCYSSDLAIDRDETPTKKLFNINYCVDESSQGFMTSVPGSKKNCIIYGIKNAGTWDIYHSNPMWKIDVNVRGLIGRELEGIISMQTSHSHSHPSSHPSSPRTDSMVKFTGLFWDDHLTLIHHSTIIGSEVLDSGYNLISASEFNLKSNPVIDQLILVSGGFVHVNSASDIDLIFTTMKFSQTKEHIDAIFKSFAIESFNENIKPAFDSFFKRVSICENAPPLPSYSEIYGQTSLNDPQYHSYRMSKFKDLAIKFFSEARRINESGSRKEKASFIASFIHNLKDDIAYELYTVYQRLRLYPQERQEIYARCDNHPYVGLIKTAHSFFKTKFEVKRFNPKNTRKYFKKLIDVIINTGLNQESMGDSGFDPRIEFSPKPQVYDEEVIKLISALKMRSSIFLPSYNAFRESVDSKTKSLYSFDYPYYPFKIYSLELFIMEHILNQD